MPPERDLLHLLSDLGDRLDGDLSLAGLAQRAGWSPFHLHRAFRRVVGETPKQYTLRLRLESAAARLVSGDDSVLDVALAAGFTSHEVFTRAFRRHFGRTPAGYRATRAAAASSAARVRHRAMTDATGPCIRLFHHLMNASSPRRATMPAITIVRQELKAQPTLFIRRRIARQELQPTLAECFGTIYAHCQNAGHPLAGPPFTRYPSTGPGLWTIEAGMPLAATARGDGEIEAGLLPGGPVAVGVHAGPYDQLIDTYAAVERWIEVGGFRTGGAPWESYTTDPAQHPDPADWRTEIYWPLAE
jgi:AraC family transcriptional regulator